MQYARRIGALEKRHNFIDDDERWLFWRSAAEGSRHLAVAVQIFGFVTWLMSRALASPDAGFDTAVTLVSVGGAVISIGATYVSRGLAMNAASRFACAAFMALAFRSNLGGAHAPAFWVLPMGVTITLGMAPVFSDYYTFIASALAVWAIMSYGEADILLRASDSNWIALFVGAGLALGLLVNFLFVQERKKTFFVQRQLARLAFRDSLTEIHNRRSFMLAIDDCGRTGSSQADSCLLLIDVDDFKRINDTSGHDIGDQALVAVAGAIERSASPHVCGRLGGEEFGVIFVGTPQEACALAGRICRDIAALTICGHAMTVSIGIAKVAPGASTSETYRLADRALYEAKRRGKNRFVLAGSFSTPGQECSL